MFVTAAIQQSGGSFYHITLREKCFSFHFSDGKIRQSLGQGFCNEQCFKHCCVSVIDILNDFLVSYHNG